MNKQLYRFVSSGRGIYAAVEQDCPRDDQRRKDKPDGSWLPKEGVKHNGAISFWKEQGLKKYVSSGLLNWHASVVRAPVTVQIIKRPAKILHEDEYQIICMPADVVLTREEPLERF